MSFSAPLIADISLTPADYCAEYGLVDQQGVLEQVVNDVSLINETLVACIIRPTNIDDVIMLVKWSYGWNQKNTDKKIGISIAGTRHSQGGHISNKQGITLDLSRLNRVYKPLQRNGAWEVKVEAGALWNQVHDVIKSHEGLALANKVQQSSTPFSVGGSISVNAHGRSFSYGSIIHSVQSIRVVLPTGEVIDANRKHNSEVFRSAIGGYGLMGVIVEVTIELVPNHELSVEDEQFDTIEEYVEYIRKKLIDVGRGEIRRNDYGQIEHEKYSPISYLFATISLNKKNFLKGISSYIYWQKEAIDNSGELNPDPEPKILNKAWFTKIGFWLKQRGLFVETAQKFQHKFLLNQNTRLKTLTPPIKPILAASSKTKPDLLQEYFIPVERLPEFFKSLRSVFNSNEIKLSNVSLRFIPKSDDRSLLTYVSDTEDQFAVVLYFSMGIDDSSIKSAKSWTRILAQSAIVLGGRHYLPYQRWPTKKQVTSAYPALNDFNMLKKSYDPYRVFTNHFYQYYFKEQSGHSLLINK